MRRRSFLAYVLGAGASMVLPEPRAVYGFTNDVGDIYEWSDKVDAAFWEKAVTPSTLDKSQWIELDREVLAVVDERLGEWARSQPMKPYSIFILLTLRSLIEDPLAHYHSEQIII